MVYGTYPGRKQPRYLKSGIICIPKPSHMKRIEDIERALKERIGDF